MKYSMYESIFIYKCTDDKVSYQHMFKRVNETFVNNLLVIAISSLGDYNQNKIYAKQI